jgi:hypothetical protein
LWCDRVATRRLPLTALLLVPSCKTNTGFHPRYTLALYGAGLWQKVSFLALTKQKLAV